MARTIRATHVVIYDLHWIGVEADANDYANVNEVLKSLGGRRAKTETTWFFDEPLTTKQVLYDEIVSELSNDHRIEANRIDLVVIRANGRLFINDRAKI